MLNSPDATGLARRAFLAGEGAADGAVGGDRVALARGTGLLDGPSFIDFDEIAAGCARKPCAIR